MQIKLLKSISKIFFIVLIITIPAKGFGESVEDFPFHIGETVEKEMTYPYAFDVVWLTALAVVENINADTAKQMQEKGIEPFMTNIVSDKSSGLITQTTTHTGKKGFFTATISPTFTYQVLLVKPFGKQKTRIYYNGITYVSYDSYVFADKAFIRHLSFVPLEKKILKEIQSRLAD